MTTPRELDAWTKGRRTFAIAIALGPTALAFGLGVAGCEKDRAPTTVPTATPSDTAPPSADAGTADKACRDWSTLDVETLRPLPKGKYIDTFDSAWRTVLEKHYDPTLGCLDWPAIRTEYGEKVAAAKDEAAAYAAMNEMLGELEQSHFAIIPPVARTGGEVRGGIQMGTARIPVDVRYLDEQVVIVDNRAFGLKSGLPAGAALISVDDAEVAPMVEAMKKTWPKPIEASFRIALTASAWLTCPPDAKKKVTFVPHGAKKPKTKTVKCREPKVERLSMGNIKDFPATFESKMLPGKIGYVRFNIWLLPLAAKIQQAIHDLKADEMKGLVIDLRGNPGGVGMMVVPVGRVLVDKPTSLGTMRLREMTQDFKIVEPDAPFEGPVVLLVDERTGSTSEIFAVALRELGRVTVVGGSPSQGAALPSLIEELPGGARLQYVVADYRTPGGDVVEGKGVQPDVLVDESAADFAAGKDPALEAAIAAASGEAPPPRTAPEAGAASDAKTGATPEKKDQ